jgi:hypothetical protein
MTAPVYAAVFMGQGGLMFSWGMKVLVDEAREKGIGAWLYSYSEVERAKADIAAVRGHSKIALVGYSLGCTTATWLQTDAGGVKPDLVICIAESTLAENHPVTPNTGRSVLFAGTDFLSSAGQHDGFDEVVHVAGGTEIPILHHLSLQFADVVRKGVLAELVKLKGN